MEEWVSNENTLEVSQSQIKEASGLPQGSPCTGHQNDMSKDQEQPSTSSSDVMVVDQPRDLPGDSLAHDHPTTSSGEKGLQPKLPFSISPKCILPVPQVQGPRPEKKAERRRGKTVVITSSPYKIKLEMEEKERAIKKQVKTKKVGEKVAKKSIFKIPKNKCERKINKKEKGKELPGSAKTEHTVTTKSKETPNPGVKSETIKNSNKPSASSKQCMSSSSEDQTEAGETCIFCNALYLDSKSGEGWIQCSGCQGWAHEACSQAEEEDDTFLCDFCSALDFKRSSFQLCKAT